MATMYNEGYSVAVIEGFTVLYENGKDVMTIPNAYMLYVAHMYGVDKDTTVSQEDGMVKIAKIIHEQPSILEKPLDVRVVANINTREYYNVILDTDGKMFCCKDKMLPGCMLPFMPRNPESEWVIFVQGRIAPLPLEFNEQDVYSYVLHCPDKYFSMVKEENIHLNDYMHLVRYILNSNSKDKSIYNTVLDIVSKQKAYIEMTQDEADSILNFVYSEVPEDSREFLGNNKLDIAVLYAMLYLGEEDCVRFILEYNGRFPVNKHFKFVKQCNQAVDDKMSFLRNKLLR